MDSEQFENLLREDVLKAERGMHRYDLGPWWPLVNYVAFLEKRVAALEKAVKEKP